MSGQKPSAPNNDIDAIEDIVAKIKNRKEVIDEYMRQWDRELSIKRETKEEDALNTIRFGREDGLPDETIHNLLNKTYKFSDQMINDLFAKVDSEQAMTTK
ncbi:hypothetical protein [Butyrivibrio sp. AE2015]|uniref:hypothetical protein n=1 Tax=Butyrivibrio sp. AE2015 TaxID=1280663 RepID=UPI00041A90BF|nr:hypothetical protein [Butyrivibrio sp. AE2015]